MPSNLKNLDQTDIVIDNGGGESERIRREDLRPVSVPCKNGHEYKLDPTEDTETFYGVVCKNCPFGKLVKK